MWALLPVGIGAAVYFWSRRDAIQAGPEPVDTDEGTLPPLVMDIGDDMHAVAYKNGAPYSITLASIANGKFLRGDAAIAYNNMMAVCPGGAAPLSGYRSNEEQTALYELYRSGHGNLAAPPGYSNHQEGLSVDEMHINPSKPDYNQEKDLWLQSNCERFGWKRDGLNFGEPWHMTFQG